MPNYNLYVRFDKIISIKIESTEQKIDNTDDAYEEVILRFIKSIVYEITELTTKTTLDVEALVNWFEVYDYDSPKIAVEFNIDYPIANYETYMDDFNEAAKQRSKAAFKLINTYSSKLTNQALKELDKLVPVIQVTSDRVTFSVPSVETFHGDAELKAEDWSDDESDEKKAQSDDLKSTSRKRKRVILTTRKKSATTTKRKRVVKKKTTRKQPERKASMKGRRKGFYASF